MSKNSLALLLMLAMTVPSAALADETVDGVVGMSVVHGRSFMAVWVPLQADQAIAGVRWYHNDGTVPFPALLATAGGTDDPGSSQAAAPMAAAVTGASQQWCAQSFDEPVASAGDGLYVLFQLASGSAFDHAGAGGGAGLGYRHAPGGAWLSLDGELWGQLHPDYRLAVEPILVEADALTLRLEPAADKRLAAKADSPPVRTELLPAAPNPFNPQTKLRFSLERAGRIDLSVYDLRGRKVVTLASGPYAAGPHEVTWQGRDDEGHSAASGLYLAKLAADGLESTQRLTLVR